jgi:pyruvate,water dikinase
MATLIASLDAPTLLLADAGGKGHNLGAMRRAGFPVPSGFVVTTAAYRRFVAENGLAATIDDQWAGCDPSQPDSFEQASAAIRAAFGEAAMAPELAQAVGQAYTALGDGDAPAVAVRSSATAEDLPDASFAGQQDTYLNIRGDEALLDAVKRCWGSLWTARAMAYRFRQGIAPGDVSLAVVVQVMAPATAAGVLFTVNPVTGNTGEMVVNATWGLGEALVSGRVNPDTILVEKATGRIQQVELGDKAVMTAETASGTAEVAVDDARRQQQAVDAAQVTELARLGRALEAHFGAPQDIEWAVAGGQVVLLQARPVTTMAVDAVPGDDAWPPGDAPAPQPFDYWTTYDVGERWPEPVTPLTWSTGAAMIQENMDDTLQGIKAGYMGKIQWSKRAFGHVYLNEGAMVHVYSDGAGFPKSMMNAAMTGVVPASEAENRYKWGRLLRHAPWILQTFTRPGRDVTAFETEFPQIDRWVDDFMAADWNTTADGELWRAAQGLWRDRAMHYMRYHSSATSTSMTSYTQMESFLARAYGDKEITQKLAGGLTGVIAAEIVPSLWQMARTLDAAGLSGLVLDQPPAVALAALRRMPEAASFLKQLDTFLRRHGHRCMSEAEWLHPRWIEAPEQVVESVAGYLRAGASFDPSAAAAKAVAEREAAIHAVETKLNPVQRAYFRWGNARLERFVRARDNGQHYLVKLLLPVRCIYAMLGRRWAERGWLAAPDDFFFLVVEEIERVMAAGSPQTAGLDLQRIAAGRRTAYDYWFSQPMPDVLDAAGQPVAFEAAREASAEGQVLVGMAASRGRVTGTARVVMTPKEAASIRPGEILVTRATDPGWTPVFSVIGGAVIEIGGLLSHGAIVAREYGLPAVVNIPQATQLIRDGQQITVDGGTGRVVLTGDR